MYKLLKETAFGPAQCVQRLTDYAFIPMNEANTDYQEYLQWLSEGNTPEPAEEQQ